MSEILIQDNKLIQKPFIDELPDKLDQKPELIVQSGIPELKATNVINPDTSRMRISLPGCGYNIVSVVCANGYIYAGSDGYVYKLDTNGTILATNNLSGRGFHEVRLTVNGSQLVLGTNGYVVLLSLSDLSVTQSTSLPGCGYNIVSVLANSSYIYAGSNGYVYKLDAAGNVLHTNGLKGMGHNEVRLAVSGSQLVVGTNGYVLLLSLNDLNTNHQTSLPSCGYNIVSVIDGSGSIYAGSNGYVYKLDSNGKVLNTNGLSGRGHNEVRLAFNGSQVVVGTNGYVLLLSASNLATIKEISLPDCGYHKVTVQAANGNAYAGSNGYLYILDSSGNLLLKSNLPGTGYDEVNLDISDSRLTVGTNGYVVLDLSTWMKKVSDSKLVCEINIPGAHDAAAINETIHTPYSCQDYTITNQLMYGIRLLDVRIKVYEKSSVYTFYTCHGDIGANTYQSLISLMDECKNFLTINGSEAIIMSIKIDDWNGATNRAAALNALTSLLNSYPVYKSRDMPQLQQVRGKIFLYNRINDDLSLGAPISWSDNTSGSYASNSSNRKYNVYVQDKYKDLPTIAPTAEKFKLVIDAFAQKKTGEVVWNFASATWFGITGIYVQPDLLDWFGKNAAVGRPANFGWTLFDYPEYWYRSNTYGVLSVITIIVNSNFGYISFPETYKLTSYNEL